ncbi:MAG: aquaporin family protein [Cyclobacteriaceae bacterium]|nr:aquaporin family protein [Cyclobacteriaceae bacterium]
MSPYLAEFVGTAILITLGGGVVAGSNLKNSYSEKSGWLAICVCWGLAVTFAIYAVGNISGAHINPAVTLGFAIAGDFPWNAVPGYIVAQVLGAMTGATLIWVFYKPHWRHTSNTAAKLGVFCTSPAERSLPNNLASELIATFFLMLGLSYIGENNFADGLNPIVIGALITIIGLGLGGTTGFAINPARDFGPRLMHAVLPISGKGGSDWAYAWVPIAGPIIGGMTGTLFFKAFFAGVWSYWFWIFMLLSLAIIIYAACYKQPTRESVS